jgi:hypothetical protein
MFNDYEIYMLSKLKQEEIELFAKEHRLFNSTQDKNTTLNFQVMTQPRKSTLCCDSPCC